MSAETGAPGDASRVPTAPLDDEGNHPAAGPTPGAAVGDPSPLLGRLRAWARAVPVSREVGLLVLIGLTCAGAALRYPATFPTADNARAILRGLAGDGIMASGMMLLLIGGLFDLSVGGLFSLTGVITGWLLQEAGVPVPLAVLGGLATGALGGWLNGFIVAKVKVNALIATLGTAGIFRGLAVLVGGPGITFLPEGFTRLGQTEFLGIQTPVWLMLAVAAVMYYGLARTRLFRRYYYIGSNERAAALSGINVPRMQLLAFTVMGLLAGLAGVASAARFGSAVSTVGDGAELRVITAVILGGASLTGGKGTVWGALLGIAFVALIQNVLIIGAIAATWQSIIIGTVLVLAVATDSLVNRG